MEGEENLPPLVLADLAQIIERLSVDLDGARKTLNRGVLESRRLEVGIHVDQFIALLTRHKRFNLSALRFLVVVLAMLSMVL